MIDTEFMIGLDRAFASMDRNDLILSGNGRKRRWRKKRVVQGKIDLSAHAVDRAVSGSDDEYHKYVKDAYKASVIGGTVLGGGYVAAVALKSGKSHMIPKVLPMGLALGAGLGGLVGYNTHVLARKMRQDEQKASFNKAVKAGDTQAIALKEFRKDVMKKARKDYNTQERAKKRS